MIADCAHVAKRIVILLGILDDVRVERDLRSLDEDRAIGTVVLLRVAIVRVVQLSEVRGDSDWIEAGLDVLQNARVPYAFLALAVGPVMIQVAELADERAFPDSGAADDRNPH